VSGLTAATRPVLPRDAFSRLVLVERRRSERSGRPFAILVLHAPGSLDPTDAPLGQAVRDAVMAATRETDVAGWIAPCSALGILLPDLPESGPWAQVECVRMRVERALGRHPAARDVKVAGRLFPEPAPAGAGAVLQLTQHFGGDVNGLVEALLYPELREVRGACRRAQALKRGLDIVGSAALLGAAAPLMFLIAGLVRLTSPGPVLFRQVRIGYRGRPFTMLKFRTMFVNANETVHREFVTRFIADGQRATAPNGAGLFKLVGDPRITSIGRLLRKSSLDELPQLWNVLRGEMSLVGPRPPLPYELEEYALWHRRRIFEARPGLTGLWQVHGRSRTRFDEIVRLDLCYARTQSLSTDLQILLATPRAVISGTGAH
jgi:lipopolysaccharide/colanic/teichoic acid biosynthesis glycosyltransferase